MDIYNEVDWANILRNSARSLDEERRHNQASVLREAAKHIDHIAAELARLRAVEAVQQTPCVWKQQDDHEWNMWETTCGNAFFFEEGTPHENYCKFCCYCGHPLEQEAIVPEPWEDEE